MSSNLEAMARALCERDVSGKIPDDNLALHVDRYWPVVAAEIEAGLRADDGSVVPHDQTAGLKAWLDWQTHNPWWQRTW